MTLSAAIRAKLASFADITRRACKASLQVRPVQRVWQWIDEHVVIPQVISSVNPGPLDTRRMPFWRGIWDRYWDKRTHKITICASARVGKTLFCICCVLHKIAIWPAGILWLDPTGKTAKKFSRNEMQAHILECEPAAARAIIDKTHWTVQVMHFLGMVLQVMGSGSAADLAGFQAEMVVINETDKIKHTIKGEALSQDLAIARSKHFRNTKKVIENSTPTLEWGRIWTEFKKGSQDYVYCPCPHCGHKQRFTFFTEEKEVPFDEDGKPLAAGEKRIEKTGRFKFDHLKDPVSGVYDIERVERETVYECAKCAKSIPQTKQAWMLRRYELRSHNPKAPRDHFSVHVWAALSPFEGWGMIAKEFLQAIGSATRMHHFYNSTLGLPFVRKATDIKVEDIDLVISRSPEYFLRQIPRKPEMLTMCVDVGGDGFWWTIRAWGIDYDSPDLRTWSALVDYGQAVSWDQIEEIAGMKADPSGRTNKYTFKDAAGTVHDYIVYAGLIDSGFEAQLNKNVYAFTRRNADIFSPSKGGGWAQLRGQDIRLSPVDNDQQDLVWYYDDGFKQQIYHHCIKDHLRPWWLPRNLGADYKEQCCHERTEEKVMPDGQPKLVWVRDGPNHLPDTEKLHEVLRDTVESKLDEIREEYLETVEKNPA